jgi:hypothetical protein
MYRSHVRWVPGHHSMSCPQVADGGNTLQVWRVAMNILNTQSRTADKEWSCSSGLGVGQTTTHHKKISLLLNLTGSLRTGEIPWINDLSERKWI